MIDQATIDRIVDAADITEVVGDFISLKKRGVNYLGNCPFHNEKTPSFTVSPSKQIFKCFGCGEGGNAVNFIMKHESFSYVEALKYLGKRFNIEIEEEAETPEEAARRNHHESLIIASNYAQTYFSNYMTNENEGRIAGLGYFKERGFRDDIIKKFNLGYCPDKKNEFTTAAQKQGYKMEVLEATGLTIKRDNWIRDRFSGRVMFPFHNLAGRVIGFGGRILKADPKAAKYLNSPESEIYHKSKVLYGIYFAKNAITRNDKCFLVEGYTDVISFHQSGIENVVASSGTSLTSDQIRLIKRFTSNITVIYDGDAAGIKASLRGIDMILEQGINVKVISLPEGEDPDSFAQARSSSELKTHIEENEIDFIRFKTNLLMDEAKNDPIAKSRLISDIVHSIAVIPAEITQTLYIQECSRLLGMTEQVLFGELKRLKLNHIEESRKKEVREANQRKRQEQIHTQQPQSYTPHQNTSSQQSPSNLPPEDLFIPGDKPQQKEPAQPVQAQARPVIKVNPCEVQELAIVRVLVRYGTEKAFKFVDEETNEEEFMDVGSYIIGELHNDELSSSDPNIQKIFDEYAQKIEDETFIPEKYFTLHPNSDISKMISGLVVDKHFESALWRRGGARLEDEKEILHTIVPKLIAEYKSKKIAIMIQHALDEINRTTDDDFDRIMELQQYIFNLKKVDAELSKNLGIRTILR